MYPVIINYKYSRMFRFKNHLLSASQSNNIQQPSIMSARAKDILYLFDRPAEPIYVPKGEEKVSFDIPENYLVRKKLSSYIIYDLK